MGAILTTSGGRVLDIDDDWSPHWSGCILDWEAASSIAGYVKDAAIDASQESHADVLRLEQALENSLANAGIPIKANEEEAQRRLGEINILFDSACEYWVDAGGEIGAGSEDDARSLSLSQVGEGKEVDVRVPVAEDGEGDDDPNEDAKSPDLIWKRGGKFGELRRTRALTDIRDMDRHQSVTGCINDALDKLEFRGRELEEILSRDTNSGSSAEDMTTLKEFFKAEFDTQKTSINESTRESVEQLGGAVMSKQGTLGRRVNEILGNQAVDPRNRAAPPPPSTIKRVEARLTKAAAAVAAAAVAAAAVALEGGVKRKKKVMAATPGRSRTVVSGTNLLQVPSYFTVQEEEAERRQQPPVPPGGTGRGAPGAKRWRPRHIARNRMMV
jgi:hypothetical protein